MAYGLFIARGNLSLPVAMSLGGDSFSGDLVQSSPTKETKKFPCWNTAREEIWWDEEVTCANFADAAQRKGSSK